MPKIILSNRQTALVTKEVSEKLQLLKYGEKGIPAKPPNTPIRIKNFGTVELRDMKMFIKDEESPMSNFNVIDKQQQANERNRQREQEMKTWNSSQKAERVLRTFALIRYKTRFNPGEIRDPLYSKLFHVIYNYFEENQKETHCPVNIYQDLIPTNQPTGAFKKRI